MQKVFIFQCCLQNVINTHKKRDGQGKLRTGQGKVMGIYFVKSVGTLFLELHYMLQNL